MAAVTTTRDILIAARALIATPEKWTQGAFRRDARGAECKPSTAVCWCSVGAIMSVDSEWSDSVRAQDIFARVIDNINIARWNDAPGRTHTEVLQAFDMAIAKAGE